MRELKGYINRHIKYYSHENNKKDSILILYSTSARGMGSYHPPPKRRACAQNFTVPHTLSRNKKSLYKNVSVSTNEIYWFDKNQELQKKLWKTINI